MDLGDFFWALLAFYVVVYFFMILFRILGDLFSDPAESGVSKTVWVIALLVVPFLSMFVYLIKRGQGMTERSIAKMQAAEAAQQAYIRDVSGIPSQKSPTEQIAQGQELLASGAITAVEYDALKTKALA